MLVSGSAHSKTWHVRQDGTGDTQYVDVAVLWAQTGDTVLVGPGDYYQSTIWLGAIHLISEAGPQSTSLILYPAVPEQDVHVIVIEGIDSCSVEGFTLAGAGGGVLNSGGGILIGDSPALIRGNIITDNWCASGGGVSCGGSPAPVIEGNLFYGNGAIAGAAIEIYQCSPRVGNNTIVDNHANDGAGAIYLVGAQSFPVIVGNIIVGNGATTFGALYGDTPANQITLRCNDVWGNLPSNYDTPLTDQTGSNGNISQDPLFCGVTGSGNYYLQVNSPCAEGHVPAYCGGSRMGCYPVKCSVAVKKNSWSDMKSLFK
jgi:parallel beta-helix repeat protein